MDEIFLPTPNAEFPELFEENAILPFGVDDWVGIVDLLRHDWFQHYSECQEIQLRNRNCIMVCRGIVEQWESIRKVIQTLFGCEPLPNAVTALINGCIWVTKFEAVFDLETILTIEEAIETVDRIQVGSLGFTQNTTPSWYPDIAKF